MENEKEDMFEEIKHSLIVKLLFSLPISARIPSQKKKIQQTLQHVP